MGGGFTDAYRSALTSLNLQRQEEKNNWDKTEGKPFLRNLGRSNPMRDEVQAIGGSRFDNKNRRTKKKQTKSKCEVQWKPSSPDD